MKQIFKIIMMACASVLFWAACSEEPVVIDVQAQSALTAEVNGGTYEIPVTTKNTWVATTDVEWIRIVGGEGTGTAEDKVVVEVEANTTAASRTAVITLSVGDQVAATVNVSQAGDAALAFNIGESKALIVEKAGAVLSLKVAANVPFTCTSSDEWLAVTTTPSVQIGEALQDVTVKVTVPANESGVELSGTISIAGSGLSDEITIYQRGVGSIVYCKVGGNGQGASWADAYGDIDAAMAACADKDVELWVAEGEYVLAKPLKKQHINCYGGFAGTEIAVAQRDRSKKSIINAAGAYKVLEGYSGEKFTWMDSFVLTGVKFVDANEGAIALYGKHGLRNCIITGNKWARNPGGYYDGTKLINCLIYGNSGAKVSGSVQVANGGEMINCTVVGNTPEKGCACDGVRVSGVATKVVNTVVWGNSGSGNKQLYVDGNGQGNFINCAIQDGLVYGGATGAVASSAKILTLTDTDPGFKDAASKDFSLVVSSCLINAGDNSYVNWMYDLAGNVRVSGTSVDLGAYEYKTN